jgi:hypothetical protein
MAELSFTTSQICNRRAIGYLYERRSQLDPGQFDIIKSIYNNKKKTGNLHTSQVICYKLSNELAGKLGYGRLYGTKGSFETLERECRGTICKEYYHDIDIVNCHPVILVQFAKRFYNIDLPEVDRYVENRETFITNVMEEFKTDREGAKKQIITVIYGGVAKKGSYLYDMSQEIRAFSKKLYLMPEYQDLAIAVKTKDNVYGSFLSFVLQTEERKCMFGMKEFFETEGWSVDVICYDGVMIRKREGILYNLTGCEMAIFQKTGYEIKLVSKEFSSYDLPPLEEEVVKGVSMEAYKEMKEKFEENHFYHSPSDRFVEVIEDASMLFMTLPHAHQVLNNKWCFKISDKFGDNIPFLDIWKKDANYKVCTETSFKKTENPEVFTLPINFAYNKKDIPPSTRALELFHQLIDLNTSGDKAVSDYMLDYFAHMIQKPTELPGVALVITGSKGTGKDTLGDFLQEWVVGNHLSTNYTTNRQFFEKHDMGKINKFLIKLEETSRKDCMENASELKATITARQVTCNPKGVKEITSDNFARYIFTTNKTNPVDLADRERRFVLSRCSPSKQGDYVFWTEVREVLFTKEGGWTVGDYLANRDISKFQVRKLPENSFQASVVNSEKPSEEKFIEQWKGLQTSAENLYKEYVEFCVKNSLQYVSTCSWFGRLLQTYVRDGKITNTHPGNVSYFQKR